MMNPPRKDDDEEEAATWGQVDPTHLRALADRIWQLSQQVAVANERIKQMAGKVDDLESEVKELTVSANRWKGGLAVIFALGTLAGASLNFLVKMWSGGR